MVCEPVVVVTPVSGSSPYGGQQYTWDLAAREAYQGYMAQPNSTEGNSASRTVDASTWKVVLRGAPPVRQECRIEYRGEVYRIVGRPKRVGVRGRIHHTEIIVTPLGVV